MSHGGRQARVTGDKQTVSGGGMTTTEISKELRYQMAGSTVRNAHAEPEAQVPPHGKNYRTTAVELAPQSPLQSQPGSCGAGPWGALAAWSRCGILLWCLKCFHSVWGLANKPFHLIHGYSVAVWAFIVSSLPIRLLLPAPKPTRLDDSRLPLPSLQSSEHEVSVLYIPISTAKMATTNAAPSGRPPLGETSSSGNVQPPQILANSKNLMGDAVESLVPSIEDMYLDAPRPRNVVGEASVAEEPQKPLTPEEEAELEALEEERTKHSAFMEKALDMVSICISP